jgi:hypothetical protein
VADVNLVTDDSGSMRGKRGDVITAGLPGNIPFTYNIQLLRTALSRDPARGKTALYDAVAFALSHLDAVGLFDPDDPDGHPEVLQRLAKVTGGESFRPAKSEEIIPICEKIAKDLRNRYTIGYFPAHSSDGAALRKIRLTAADPTRGKLIVQTRTSYMLPPGR